MGRGKNAPGCVRGLAVGASSHQYSVQLQRAGSTIRPSQLTAPYRGSKVQGLVNTGGHAKLMIQGGEVKVDGEVETRRGRKLRAGDKVEIHGQTVVVRGDVGGRVHVQHEAVLAAGVRGPETELVGLQRTKVNKPQEMLFWLQIDE